MAQCNLTTRKKVIAFILNFFVVGSGFLVIDGKKGLLRAAVWLVLFIAANAFQHDTRLLWESLILVGSFFHLGAVVRSSSSTESLESDRMSDDKAVSVLSEKIIANSLLCSKGLADDYADAMEMHAAVEWCFVFMHVVDREAFAILGHPRRKEFVDNLQANVLVGFLTSGVTDDGKSYIREMVHSLNSAFIERTQEYGRCPEIYPEKGQPMGNTVLWEFGEHAAAAVGREHDPAVILRAIHLAVTGLGLIDATSTISCLSRESSA
jgi:hypothetical protein